MAHFTVTGTVTARPYGRIIWTGEKPLWQPEPGIQFARSTVHDLTAAARYLLAETAAVSCTCNGYRVTKHR